MTQRIAEWMLGLLVADKMAQKDCSGCGRKVYQLFPVRFDSGSIVAHTERCDDCVFHLRKFETPEGRWL